MGEAGFRVGSPVKSNRLVGAWCRFLSLGPTGPERRPMLIHRRAAFRRIVVMQQAFTVSAS